jgi:hypothetical protein
MSSNISAVLSCKVSIRIHPWVSIRPNTVLIDYFTKLLEDDLKAVVKPQYVDQIPKAVRAADKSVKTLITSRSQMDNLEEVCDILGRHSQDIICINLLTIYRAEPCYGS